MNLKNEVGEEIPLCDLNAHIVHYSSSLFTLESDQFVYPAISYSVSISIAHPPLLLRSIGCV